jgi:hypothetical protein
MALSCQSEPSTSVWKCFVIELQPHNFLRFVGTKTKNGMKTGCYMLSVVCYMLINKAFWEGQKEIVKKSVHPHTINKGAINVIVTE